MPPCPATGSLVDTGPFSQAALPVPILVLRSPRPFLPFVFVLYLTQTPGQGPFLHAQHTMKS